MLDYILYIDARLFYFDNTKFEFRDSHKIIHKTVDPLAVGLDGLQEFDGMIPVIDSALQQRIGKPLNGSDRGLYLVGDVGDEILSGLFEPFQLRDVMEDGDKP